MLKVGIDIGGTKIAGGVVDADGRIVEKLRVDTPIDTRALADAVVDMSRHFESAHEIAAVGVAAAGFIDRDRANVIHAPNIAWRDEPLKAILEARIDVPVTIENDANAAGWAEFRFGAGRDVDDMVMLTMGTGVGGAVIAERSAVPRGPRHRRRARPHPLHPRWAALRLRAERMPRAVCVRSRPAARGERDRGCRGHRRRAGAGPRAEGLDQRSGGLASRARR